MSTEITIEGAINGWVVKVAGKLHEPGADPVNRGTHVFHDAIDVLGCVADATGVSNYPELKELMDEVRRRRMEAR
jgi:hypothetical protein